MDVSYSLENQVKDTMIKKPIALFIIANKAQLEMFGYVRKHLEGWDALGVLRKKIHNYEGLVEEIEKLNFHYKYVDIYSEKKILSFLYKEGPNIVILGQDSNINDKLFIKAANFIGIPTLLIQDGILPAKNSKKNINKSVFFTNLVTRTLKFIMNNKYNSFQKLDLLCFELEYNIIKRKSYEHLECSKIAVFGKARKDILISEGFSPEKIVITGNPKFDLLFHNNKYPSVFKKKVCDKFGIPFEKDIVLLLTQYFVEIGQWGEEQRHKFVLSIAKAANELPNVKLIIKLHPYLEGDYEDEYSQIFENISLSPIICKHTQIDELLIASSLVITVSSTVALEAMTITKPVMIVNLFNDDTSFYQNSGLLEVNKEDDILLSIKNILYDFRTKSKIEENNKSFVYHQAYIQDGNASKRIANLILSMME